MSETKTTGRVVFIGAGPGDPELLTLKAARLIAEAGLVLYAGSLVPMAVVAHASPGARVLDSSSMTLEATHALLRDCAQAGRLAARVHTGDPSLYGATAEQAALLDRDGIPWEVVPGVPSAFAAAAAARTPLTFPGGAQSVIISRLAGRTPVPEAEALRHLAAHGASLAIYLSAGDPAAVQQELRAAGLPGDTAIVVAHRVGWPEQIVLQSTLDEFPETVLRHDITRQTVFLVLPGKSGERSRLYDPDFVHGFRP